MKKYKLISPKNPMDGTQTIILENDESGNPTKTISIGGEPQELSQDQYNVIKNNFILVEVKNENTPVVAPISKPIKVTKEVPAENSADRASITKGG